MKKLYFVIAFLTLICLNNSFAQTADPPSGSGTVEAPYLVTTLNNLYCITQNSAQWNKVYKQTADIDASATSTWAKKFPTIGN